MSRSNFSSNARSSLSNADDDYIARMIDNTEIVHGMLYPTEVQDMTEVYEALEQQNNEASESEEDSDGEDYGGDEAALHEPGWMFWNVLAVVGVAVVAWVVFKYRE
ncbi:hypothetical protein IQ06DRAFT_309327 [Phaeosphaeriaceae sp. SRC1lsM3a]|nr:hypothetical protein IQ06DRAFT_309327 [Stagonospora sp. SRC1lsM3a]